MKVKKLKSEKLRIKIKKIKNAVAEYTKHVAANT
jgi:hypothetical protein